MKYPAFYLLLLIFCLITSCTEPYQLPDMDRQTTIVITGLITNEPGPYYVRIMENISDFSTGNITRRGINDARVTITDSNGNVDELLSFYSLALDSVMFETEWGNYPRYFYGVPGEDGDIVRFFLNQFNEKFDIREGKYFTTSIKGVPGHTYTLKVEYAGREYIATDYMCYGTVIDSLTLEPLGRYIYDKPDGSDGFLVPCIYFAEPQNETNFYMFEAQLGTYRGFSEEIVDTKVALKNLALRDFNASGAVSEGNPFWSISVISDRFLPPYVYQYKVSDGDSPRKYEHGTDIGFHGWFDMNWVGYEFALFINMYCITESIYRYHYALSRQYYDDGGVFSPSPASPPTNISGGAQGCFSAASVSQYFLDLRNEK